MNVALFFEGTGQGVHGRETNVSRLYRRCVASADQGLHLESGPGTHFGAYLFGKAMGVDARAILGRARRWFQQNAAADAKVFLFGFSRGALLARHFAAWLDKLNVGVVYLGVWDTVDSTPSVEVATECPSNVRRARHAVARDEFRRHFDYVPLRGARVEEMLFPGCHSDVGGLYEDNHALADVTLDWIAAGAAEAGLRLDAAPSPDDGGANPPRRYVIHNSLNLVSNLFGLLGRIRRSFGDMVRHPLCERLTQRA